MIAASPLCAGIKLHVIEGRPIVDGVYVNGHGPYRFLIDTGANVNLIESGLARKLGMSATFQVDFESLDTKTRAQGSDGNEVVFGSVQAERQKFLFSPLDAIHIIAPEARGVLGQWFLSQFDYAIDLWNKRIEFGRQDWNGMRVPFKVINARPVVLTSLGPLALDSGAGQVVLFGTGSDASDGIIRELKTAAGSEQIGMVSGKSLVIQG